MPNRPGALMARFPGRRARTSAIAIAVLVAITTIAAQDLGYMSELPAVARVVADNRVESARESAVRAQMALEKLAGVVQMLSQTKGRQPTPSEAAKVLEYRTAAADVIREEQAKAEKLCGYGGALGCEGNPIARCSQDFQLLPEFSREVLDRYFSPQWQVQYAGALQGGGGVWRQALLLPPGTKTGRPRADADCADGSKTLAEQRTATPTARDSRVSPDQMRRNDVPGAPQTVTPSASPTVPAPRYVTFPGAATALGLETVNLTSVRREGNIATAYVLTLLATPLEWPVEAPGFRVFWTGATRQVDCAGHRWRDMFTSGNTLDFSQRRPVANPSFREWHNYVEGTHGAAMEALLCRNEASPRFEFEPVPDLDTLQRNYFERLGRGDFGPPR